MASNSEQTQIEDLVESLHGKKNATRRNLDSLGTMGVMDFTDTDIAFSDILLLFGSLMTFLIVGNVVPDGRNWALLALGMSTLLIGTVVVGIYVSPPGMSFYKWLKCKKGFKFGSDYRSAHRGDSGRITKDSISTNGDRRALEDLTRVDGFAPQSDAVWRFDGALVGGVSIDPAELSLATQADWETAADELGDIVNSLSHSGELRNGSVKIDTEGVKRKFGDRLGDTDVRSNPNLQQNVSMYKDNLSNQMESKNASIRGFQMLAPVTMEEVQMQGHRVLGRLDEFPLVGSTIASLLASRDLTVPEIRYRQEQVMNGRRNSLKKNLAGITGCDADQLSMDDLISVLEESWTGERVVTEERDDRSLPLVTMSREYTETQGDMRSPDQLADDELDQQIISDLQRSAGTIEDVPEDNVDEDLGTASEPELSDESPGSTAPDEASLGKEYDSIEEAAAALVEEMEQSDTATEAADADAETKEAMS
ncbi:hypothetical protein [Halalkalicoccus jeotgali]|uniref:TraC-like domain-containing protein n=1 Tax=Halalkalicoccus jeotgali (strain DSM 18796 / CECT 7217 / JCM 14584 / KCTC 4019 / B3) TaxID=795797 RepID=D8J9Y8_HALJB|nr:hypothetical protein [Halalkalicoccus jeotgali]ADJ14510.1 hypothetical protein HacjB3_05595 [Halalkalicoccus jeotgali B3]ELY40083.1 hypothetical protein C497_03965 [Halalkalicoccus jeotgali B3]